MSPETLGLNPGGTCCHPGISPQHPQAPQAAHAHTDPDTGGSGPLSPPYHSLGPQGTLGQPHITEERRSWLCLVLHSSCLHMNGALWGGMGR